MKKIVLSILLGTVLAVSPVISTSSAKAVTSTSFRGNGYEKGVLHISTAGYTLGGEYLEAGAKNHYTFVVPEDGYYIIQTTSNLDTYGELITPNKTYKNDDSGYKSNFKIRAKLKAGTKYSLWVSGYSDDDEGDYSLSFTFDD